MPYSSPTKTRWSSGSERRGPVAPPSGGAGPARRAERRLASVCQLCRQAILAQAGCARSGVAPRVRRAQLRVLGTPRHDIQDHARRPGGDRRRQRRRQEHPAPPARKDLSADLRPGVDSGQRRPVDRDGGGLQSRAFRPGQHLVQWCPAWFRAEPDAETRWSRFTSSPACASLPTCRSSIIPAACT